jgi:Rieske Fe-S protein
MNSIKSIKTGSLSEERREFLKKSGALSVMSLFGVGFFTSCTTDDMDPSNPTPNTPPDENNGITATATSVTVDLDVATTLASTGGWTLVTESKVLIVNMGNNTYNALTSVCTHSQCDRNWSFSNNVFTCSCHGSRFDRQGAVVNGPATQALATYPTSIDNGVLTVDLG